MGSDACEQVAASRWRRVGWPLIVGGLVAAFLARAWSADGTELSRIADWADILALLLAVGGLVLVIADKRRARHEITFAHILQPDMLGPPDERAAMRVPAELMST
ncbi:MAG: hypothetical protein ACRDZO_11490 [Egibacteraceae bacterium]